MMRPANTPDHAAATEIHGSLAIYLSDNPDIACGGGFYLKVFQGKQSRPLANYRFSNPEGRAGYLNRIKSAEDARLRLKNERCAARKSVENKLTVGDILVYVWGYEQTNVDYLQVVAKTSKSVSIREIASIEVAGSRTRPDDMSCRVVPVKDNFKSEVLVKRINSDTSVAMPHGNASLWDGRDNFCSWYG